MEQGVGGKPAAGAKPAGTSRSTASRRTAFLRAVNETCSVVLAARAAGRSVATCYRWRAEHGPFAAAWDAALVNGYDRLQSALLSHALKTMESGLGDDAVVADGEEAGAVERRSYGREELHLASELLVRRAGGDKGAGRTRPAKAPTRAEVDAALKRALDGLARRVPRA